ncbi:MULTISPECIES: hypothetical protein [Methylobacterium]|uniref:Uncharacterized protein n=1 Tax=Methylobacterium jeotgali TaxID=381630 RepID=A0ABQ4ST06_9HYPH|nr:MULTISPECIES: hypothetical protein [Methylobacterium]GBU18381.1 hypothetical protein AwMethylo_25960 [Methylobacterium sp.]GJE04958.1 hypothetical protein AOPFMNJM_0250 [Methylobacterium jeotgali]
MIVPADRQPIVVADAGPPIRLAAAGLLDTLDGLEAALVGKIDPETPVDLRTLPQPVAP